MTVRDDYYDALGELDHTYVVYTSDNGWHMGEHRQFVGKTTAYEEDIRVPAEAVTGACMALRADLAR